MKYALICLLLIAMCVFCHDSFGADNTPSILFEVDSVFIERRPRDMNELIAAFEASTEFDSNNVAAIENLNRLNVFDKPDVDVGYRIYFEFFADVKGEWQFDFIYDAGIASGVLLDQQVLLFSDLDMYNSNPIQKIVTLGDGWHTFEFLALENCCGSPIRFRVKKPDSDEFKVISADVLYLRDIVQ